MAVLLVAAKVSSTTRSGDPRSGGCRSRRVASFASRTPRGQLDVRPYESWRCQHRAQVVNINIISNVARLHARHHYAGTSTPKRPDGALDQLREARASSSAGVAREQPEVLPQRGERSLRPETVIGRSAGRSTFSATSATAIELSCSAAAGHVAGLQAGFQQRSGGGLDYDPLAR